MEFEQFGWNVLTLSAIGTIATTLFRSYGAGRQACNIWRRHSARSVSGLNLVSYSVSMIASMVYGLWANRQIVVITGFISLAVTLPSLAGFLCFERGWCKEAVLGVILIAVVAVMVMSPDKKLFYYGFAGGGMIFASHQPWKIWRNRDAGVVDPVLLAVTLASSVFWLVYWLASDGPWPMILISAAFAAISAASMAMWIIFRPRRKVRPDR